MTRVSRIMDETAERERIKEFWRQVRVMHELELPVSHMVKISGRTEEEVLGVLIGITGVLQSSRFMERITKEVREKAKVEVMLEGRPDYWAKAWVEGASEGRAVFLCTLIWRLNNLGKSTSEMVLHSGLTEEEVLEILATVKALKDPSV